MISLKPRALNFFQPISEVFFTIRFFFLHTRDIYANIFHKHNHNFLNQTSDLVSIFFSSSLQKKRKERKVWRTELKIYCILVQKIFDFKRFWVSFLKTLHCNKWYLDYGLMYQISVLIIRSNMKLFWHLFVSISQ